MEMEEFFKKLPPEIVFKILNYVYKDNDQTICETIPYLEQFINDPISKKKRIFKPLNFGYFKIYSNNNNYNYNNYICDLTQSEYMSRMPRIDYVIISTSRNITRDIPTTKEKTKKQQRRKKIKSYNHSRRQEMKYRNKNQKHFMKR
mgnify:CR=1 FL=1